MPKKQTIQSDDLYLLSKCCSLKQIARQADLDPRTAKRLAIECNALIKIGDAKNSKYLVLKDQFWAGLCSRYRVDQ